MGNQILKNLKMSSDVTQWHDVAVLRGSLCNLMMEGARSFSEFGNWGGVSYPPTPTPVTPSFIHFHLSKGNYLRNVVLKFSGSE